MYREMILSPANHYSLEELTEAYNLSRVDYLVPMPMSPTRMLEYVTLYDVNLALSRVAVSDGKIVGLGMLGQRDDECWITRLGVLPESRRQGIGEAIFRELLDEALALQSSAVWLEVIRGNKPAHDLFLKHQFRLTRELIVARRSPKAARSMKAVTNARAIHYLQHDELIELHCRRPGRANWLNAVETMRNVRKLSAAVENELDRGTVYLAPNLSGFLVEFQNGAQGWVSCQATNLQINRISATVIKGNQSRVTADVLAILHHLHASQDAVIENVADDEQWKGFQQAGYFEVFRRLEFVREFEPVNRPIANS
jgi:ribosomal protein S18 acetylase RimI-like enzyme